MRDRGKLENNKVVDGGVFYNKGIINGVVGEMGFVKMGMGFCTWFT